MIKDGGEHYKMNDEMGISNSKAIENAHLKKALGWYIYRWQMGGAPMDVEGVGCDFGGC
jgi:hypothetical protein